MALAVLLLAATALPAPAQAASGRGCSNAPAAAKAAGRSGITPSGPRLASGTRTALSLCWRVPRRGPARVADLRRAGAAVRFLASRRLSLSVAGAKTQTRRRTVLRPGRRVPVRLVSDVAGRRVQLVVDGRLEAEARIPAEPKAPSGGGRRAGGLAPPTVETPPAEPTHPAARPARAPAPAVAPTPVVASAPTSAAQTPVAAPQLVAPGLPAASQPEPQPAPDVNVRQPSPTAPVAAPDARPFAPGSFWNAPLAGDARLAPDSSSLVAELVRQTRVYDPWLNTTRYSTPVYVVESDQPAVRVTLDSYNPALERELASVPIPPEAVPAAGNDRHMVVWQPSTDRMWELWAADKRANGWHARWGGAMSDVSRNPGHFGAVAGTGNWGATATGLPLLGGLVTLKELRRGRVDHALAIAVPEARRDSFVWPAQRDDGVSDASGAIPEGTRFRLDPTLDVEAMSASPFVKMLARAAQKHGIVVRDTSGSVAFFGEDPTPTGTDPWPAVWQGGWPNQVLRGQFPWSRLQVVDPSAR